MTLTERLGGRVEFSNRAHPETGADVALILPREMVKAEPYQTGRQDSLVRPEAAQ